MFTRSLHPMLLPVDAALFLDFDGTLVPIAQTPDSIAVPPALHPLLLKLHRLLDGALAIVSGREITQLDQYLTPLQLACAGAHGTQRRDNFGRESQVSSGDISSLTEACQKLAQAHPSLYVETKQNSVALHYRRDQSLETLCLRSMQAQLVHWPQWTLLRGKSVLELLPQGVNKGTAIDAFMQEPPFVGRTPFFLGDDISDETGFAAVLSMRGVAIKVGPGVSGASHRLQSVDSVYQWLEAACAPHRDLTIFSRPVEVQP